MPIGCSSFSRCLYIVRFIIFLYLAIVPTTYAQQALLLGPRKEFFRVDAIEVEGLRKVEREAILEKITLKVGDTLDNYQLRKDIENIYSLKFFEKIEAHQQKKNGRNILVFKLKEKPTIRRLRFEGNSEEGTDDLLEQVKTKALNILDISTIKNDINLLRKYYEDKGFYLADVRYRIEQVSKDFVDVVYVINEQEKVRVKQITFLGNRELSDDFLKGFMQVQEEGFFSFMSGSGSFKEFDFQTDIERLKYIYKSKGFLQVNITNPVITVSEDKRWIFITLNVTEGPKFYINDIYFAGDLLFSEKEFFENLKLKKDEVYSEETLRQDIEKLTEMYQDKGFAFANVLRTIKIVPGENKADIYFNFEKGNEVSFGLISVSGNTNTRDKVIRRELRIHEGMKYSGSKLRISKERVERLGFFEPGSVIFKTVPSPSRDDIVDVEITVKETQTGQLQVGAGYSSATGAFFQGSISQNNFNFTRAGDIQETYRLGMTDPYFLDTLWTLGGDIYNTQSNLISSFSFRKRGANIRTGHPIGEYTRLFLTYRWEETEVQNIANPSIDEDLENGISSSMQISLVYDKRDNIMQPSKGHFVRIASEYAGLGGDRRWLRAETEGQYYKTLIGSLVLRTRLSLAQLYKVNSERIPRTEKFQMGGPRNMRGFDIEGIGPTRILTNSQTGALQEFNIGGLFSILGTLELEHPLVEEAGLKWVLFYDVGNVFEKYIGEVDQEGNRNFSLRSNYGFGFRWFSPIGILRFEFAYPINKGDDEAAQQFIFDIGQPF